jgi:hypothetical protein
VENMKKRDLSLFDGIEFYAKATERFRGYLTLLTSQQENPNKMDAWTGSFQVDPGWEKIRIPFNTLYVGRRWIRQAASRYGATPGDQVMRLDRVESFIIGVSVLMNSDASGTLWVDKIRFYNN